jgi:hypothetical protein
LYTASYRHAIHTKSCSAFCIHTIISHELFRFLHLCQDLFIHCLRVRADSIPARCEYSHPPLPRALYGAQALIVGEVCTVPAFTGYVTYSIREGGVYGTCIGYVT